MEVAVAKKALKPSMQTDLVFSQGIRDEILCLNANNVVVGEDFSVDDLFDFSNGKESDDYEEEEEEEEEEEKGSSSTISQDRIEEDSNSNSTAAADSDSIFAGELSVPADDVADLEWVSHFVDDSLPELSLLYPVRPEQTRARPEPGSAQARAPFPTCTKPRTTRIRKPRLFPSSVFSWMPLPFSGGPPAKKQRRKAEAQVQPGGLQFQRRCSHCQVQKTPQWRAGPLGPKTLCNACGVRFKSGRLFPEYRPACSPTFSGEIHSNSHRKVLEMRRRREMAGPVVAGLDQARMVPGF